MFPPPTTTQPFNSNSGQSEFESKFNLFDSLIQDIRIYREQLFKIDQTETALAKYNPRDPYKRSTLQDCAKRKFYLESKMRTTYESLDILSENHPDIVEEYYTLETT